ncbi:ABC transporter substrate-binding protein [Burkholderia ubonensis]|uniref:ABC transporter substrate-binding protein n=1 Tax=Burkholderia ubonensis TaxID=101571 RepID=UPI0007551533|nr:ABC transporter substrate-binding protein [Burkholderia ubonensis]KVD84927.1 ABC transporter substrate-binding protein [Burkholderia ubonensis]KVO99223.1 ABC transporter substrate-binding protein [Burkholderia ubonensis]KVZ55534.1 ABC transporter substrate-binding protein [Burkholderia ubonensis]KVZ68554.1 ABC transporter substrate-binding protein [Burkholderia ubonensis]
MKKWMAAVAMTLAAGAAHAGGDWAGREIRLAVDPTYPPLEYKLPDGTLAGFGVDITNALCAELRARCVWVESSFDGMIPGLLARKFDVIASSMTITPKRMQQIAFTNRISNAPARLVVRKGSLLLPSAESLKGKRVGVEQGSAQADYALANWQAAGVQIVSYPNQDQVYADLVTGRLDAAFQASIAASDGFLKKPQGKDFMFAGAPIDDPKYFGQGDGLGLRKQDVELRDAFNHALAAILANGTYARINRKYFDFDIYGAK